MDDPYIPQWTLDPHDGTSNEVPGYSAIGDGPRAPGGPAHPHASNGAVMGRSVKLWGDAETCIQEAVRLVASWELSSTPWVETHDDFITVTTLVPGDSSAGLVEVGVLLTPDGAGWLLEY